MGDPELRRMIEEAFAADDAFRKADAESDRRLEQLMQRHQQAQEMKRRNGDGLIHKQHEPEPEQQNAEKWAAWVDQKLAAQRDEFESQLKELSDGVIEFIEEVYTIVYDKLNQSNRFTDEQIKTVADRIAKLREEYGTRIQALSEEIGFLRADFTVDRGFRGQVINVPQFLTRKGGEDAA